MRSALGGGLALVVLALSGCAAPPPVPGMAPSATQAPTIGPLGAAGCSPASPIKWDGTFPEVQGTAVTGDTTLYGWIMAAGEPAIRTDTDIKIVWRMVGDGGLRVRLVSPDGTARPLVFGPEEHGGSNYDRPGREWGTGLRFDTVGCWELQFVTDTTAASVWFQPAT